MPIAALLSLASAPFADEAFAPPPDVNSAFPAVETTVPANGRLVFFGGSRNDISFVRVRGDGGEDALVHTSAPIDQFQSSFVVTLPELAIGETLVVASRCVSCEFSGAWTVVEDDTEAPAFDDGPASVEARPITGEGPFAGTASFILTVQLPPARDARSPVTIELRGDEVNRIGPEVFAPGAPITLSVELFNGAARNVCFDAFALDAAGNEGALDEQLCVDLEPVGGCAQTSPSSTASIALVLAALALVRRRRS